MKIDINKMTIEEKVGQMIGFAFKGTEYSKELQQQIEEFNVGLIIYFKDNVVNPKQVSKLNQKMQKQAKYPLFIALDQEGGMVARVTKGVVQCPGAMAISATQNPKYAFDTAYNMGTELRKIGFNFNFAPVADINNNAKNPVINVRSYSDNPDIANEYILQATKGYEKAMMMTSLKHFPGHGDTAVDSHIGLPKLNLSNERLNDIELKPFVMATKNNLPGIMASHVMLENYDNEYPTSLSSKVINGLLRTKIGYKGLVVTDSLTMKAVFANYTMEEIALNGFNSGCDILLMCGSRDMKMQEEFYKTSVRLAKEGKISLSQIDESVERILKFKEEYKATDAILDYELIEQDLEIQESMTLAEEVSLKSITVLKDECKLLPIKKEEKILIVFPKITVVTLVENDDNELTSLSDFMPFKTDKIYASITPDDKEKANILNKIKKYDKIIYCSYNACFNETQKDLINEIDSNKLIVIAVRTPYDADVLNASTMIASYEASELAFKSLAKILTGYKATGVMPVKLKG